MAVSSGTVGYLYSDTNQDGRYDWVELYDANGAAWVRGLDINTDGEVDVVHQRAGGAFFLFPEDFDWGGEVYRRQELPFGW